MSRRTRKKNRTMKAQQQINNEIAKENITMNDSVVEKKVPGSAADWSEIRQLPVGSLSIDYSYQRELHEYEIKPFIDDFNPDRVNTLLVSSRDGKYYVIDGQHRMLAIKRLFKNDSYPISCKILYGLTREGEAWLFAHQDDNVRIVPAAYKMRARALAGDKDVDNFLAVTREHGFVIEPGKRVNKTCGIDAVQKAYHCYEALGDKAYGRMLDLLKGAWHGERWSLSQNMLGGLSLFLRTYGDSVNDQRFIEKLSIIGEKQFIKQRGEFIDDSVPVAFASTFVRFYNKGSGRGQLKRSYLLDD